MLDRPATFDVSALWTPPLVGFGLRCTWWGLLDDADNRLTHCPTPAGPWVPIPGGLPRCPQCGQPLFTCNEDEWVAAVGAAYSEDVAAAWLWGRGRCYLTEAALRAAWRTRAT